MVVWIGCLKRNDINSNRLTGEEIKKRDGASAVLTVLSFRMKERKEESEEKEDFQICRPSAFRTFNVDAHLLKSKPEANQNENRIP